MNQISTMLITGGLMALLATPAMAGKDRHGTDTYYDYARVIKVRELTEIVQVDHPREVCWTEQVSYQVPGPAPQTYTPEIVGGIIGGAIGNQFGRGSGRKVATVAGVLLGGSVAHDFKNRHRHRHTVNEPVQRCEIRHEYHEEERVVGFRVKYRYQGRVYRTRMDHHPGERVKVRVQVAPVH